MTTAAARDALTVVTTTPAGLRDTAADALAAGGRLEGLFAAAGRDDRPELRLVVGRPEGAVLIRCAAPGGVVPSLVDLAPALDWDQREARDLHGLVFAGDSDHRPLVDHPADPAAWTTPATGADVHDVAVGPVHAGVIESGHFRFHTVGERVLHLDARLFHKHRGLERAAEGLDPARALAVVQRACAACAAANTVAFAHAVEQVAGAWPGERLRRARTLLLELERLYNHLNDLGQICAGVGFAPGAMAFAGFKERAQRTIGILAGHRFLFGSVAIGGGRLHVRAPSADAARRDLDELRGDALRAWRALLLDASLRDRVRGTGVLPRGEAERLGTVGPAARASGVGRDEREDAPRLWYDGFRPALPLEATGDVAARMEARAVELEATFAILDELLSAPVAASPAPPLPRVDGHGLGRVESARGLTWCAVELADGVVRRVHLRTSSYANWPSVAAAAAGALLPDFPLVNKSFELCYACADR